MDEFDDVFRTDFFGTDALGLAAPALSAPPSVEPDEDERDEVAAVMSFGRDLDAEVARGVLALSPSFKAMSPIFGLTPFLALPAIRLSLLLLRPTESLGTLRARAAELGRAASFFALVAVSLEVVGRERTPGPLAVRLVILDAWPLPSFGFWSFSGFSDFSGELFALRMRSGVVALGVVDCGGDANLSSESIRSLFRRLFFTPALFSAAPSFSSFVSTDSVSGSFSLGDGISVSSDLVRTR
mmetsp:Transcript_54248/g.123643  ORF Transcript_54248/g.123643 Transcript_54248/m.123643 type:complete len:241 (+) Transcript_54248:1184-1906(+)